MVSDGFKRHMLRVHLNFEAPELLERFDKLWSLGSHALDQELDGMVKLGRSDMWQSKKIIMKALKQLEDLVYGKAKPVERHRRGKKRAGKASA